MRAAAILGMGCSAKNLEPFQTDDKVEWSREIPEGAGQADIVLLFGGDGTIHRHLDPLVKLGLPVLVIPSGSGNDFARALGLRRIRDSLGAWRRFCAGHGNVRAIDLGVISPVGAPVSGPPAEPHHDYYFCSVAGIGLDAEVAGLANKWPRWLRGHGGYAIALVPAIFRFAPFPMKILAPDQAGEWRTRREQPTMLAAFANTPAYGGGMRIAPEAQMDDGELDVCVIGGIDPFKLVCMFPTVYFGRHLRIHEVDYFRTAHARVETETPFDVYADGELVCQTPVEITIQRRALQVVT
jgi:diacylglycerol kinase (ATP)